MSPPTLHLIDLLAALPTHVVLRFEDATFPEYTPGSDIDLLVSDIEASVRAITDLYDPTHFSHTRRTLIQDVHIHVDIQLKHKSTLHMRFDLYGSLPYSRFHLHPGIYDNILTHRIHNGKVWVPHIEDDLALRYAEYVEYKTVRPDKIKHLHYVNQADIGFVRVQPGEQNCTLRYRSCEPGCFGFIVWGHGLTHLEAIFDCLHTTMSCQVLHVKRFHPGDLSTFLRTLYAVDLGTETGTAATTLHGHIKAKTDYLKHVPRDCVFILIHKRDVRLNGEFDEDIVNVKWKVRKTFNPRSPSQPALGRLPQGISHHHVIHGIDRFKECDPICRHITGHPPMYFYQRLARQTVEVPHHISVPATCQIRTVAIAALRANILGKGLVSITHTPHFAFVSGDEDAYRQYYHQHCGKAFTDGHSCACFRRTLQLFNPKAYPYQPAKYIVVNAAAHNTWQIADGVHRSAILCQYWGVDGHIPCVVRNPPKPRVTVTTHSSSSDDSNRPVVTCTPVGGLGNQLFILLATLAYAFEHHLPVVFPPVKAKKATDGSIRSTYWDTLLCALAPYVKQAPKPSSNKRIQHIRERNAFTYTALPSPMEHTETICLTGYFQHPTYTSRHWSKLVNTLNLKSYQTDSHDAISLHFRLGDYELLRHLYPSMTTNYYLRGLAHIMKVTGREDWAIHYAMQEDSDTHITSTLEAIRTTYPHVTFVRIPPSKADWEQFIHLSCCRHNVIANSTFSWWAARLNRHSDAEVVYPNRWRTTERLCMPEHWTECRI